MFLRDISFLGKHQTNYEVDLAYSVYIYNFLKLRSATQWWRFVARVRRDFLADQVSLYETGLTLMTEVLGLTTIIAETDTRCTEGEDAKLI